MGDWKKLLRKIKNALLVTSLEDTAEQVEQSDDQIKSELKRPGKQRASITPRQDDRHVGPAGIRANQITGGKKRIPDEGTRATTPVVDVSNTTATTALHDRNEKAPAFRPRNAAARTLGCPEWIGLGESLQHPKHTGSGRPMSVRIGLDFGTAFTKVAIQAGVDSILVDWSTLTGDETIGRYVLPGIVYHMPGGEYHWRYDEQSDALINLKLPVIENAATGDCPTATLAFLALVIRYTRAYLYRHPEVGPKLAGRSLKWELNIGCPTEPHERPEVVSTLKQIARVSWILAKESTLRTDGVVSAWGDTGTVTGLEVEPSVIPEFVAQIAGYLRSPGVNNGLHALIDIGAATLDVATFNIALPTDSVSLPKIPIFFSAVELLGTHYLCLNRFKGLGLDLEWDDESPVERAEEFAERMGRITSEVDALDEQFSNKVQTCVFRIIDATRTNRRGDQISRAWTDGLPVFMTGGGAHCELYREAVKIVEQKMKERLGWDGRRFRFIEFNPLASHYRSFGKEAGHRTTVAIGLTEDAESIARIFPHREIGPRITTGRERLDHTELYSD